jgi:hypothetical protein
LTGLGGATFLVPIYVLFLGMPIQYAAGASSISTIATSSGAGSAYVRDRLTNVWIGMSLEIATTSGSIVGSLAAAWVYIHRLQRVIYILFGVVLLGSIYTQVTRSRHELPDPKPPDRWTKWLQLCSLRWWLGELIMFAAGVVSGLLGIVSGALKVVAMDWAMNLPIKVSTATSNFNDRRHRGCGQLHRLVPRLHTAVLRRYHRHRGPSRVFHGEQGASAAPKRDHTSHLHSHPGGAGHTDALKWTRALLTWSSKRLLVTPCRSAC